MKYVCQFLRKNHGVFIAILGLLAQRVLAQPPDYASRAIQSSKSWVDLDYVGDGIIGHKLDIHLPLSGKAPFPVIICIYGSAWLANNAKGAIFTDGLGQRLLKEGFAVVAINHRSSGDTLFPAQLHDVKAAIRFVRANAATFSVTDQFIGLTGYSSGGHLASLAGTTNHVKTKTIDGIKVDLEGHLGPFTPVSSHVNAVVDWFGPTNFLLMDSCDPRMHHNDPRSPESLLIGGGITQHTSRVELANPITYVSKASPPFLLIHGDKDPLVPFCQSEELANKLKQEGVKSDLIQVSGGRHGPGVLSESYYTKMVSFFTTEWNQVKN
ncbi:alpha/beta hydrolase [Spirosoma endophyticum]|uniref:Acetyl esterase/lipase n=1 Tax=Spirosoma endophyticum TaxID=662367 RepID=A0A1I2DVJ3_9BACT|nr:alpha/beta hydrolase [Spirosoma endophyticum]SFE84261.1 Acetyl esterase/lipase [Spirosoma endophyticum]